MMYDDFLPTTSYYYCLYSKTYVPFCWNNCPWFLDGLLAVFVICQGTSGPRIRFVGVGVGIKSFSMYDRCVGIKSNFSLWSNTSTWCCWFGSSAGWSSSCWSVLSKYWSNILVLVFFAGVACTLGVGVALVGERVMLHTMLEVLVELGDSNRFGGMSSIGSIMWRLTVVVLELGEVNRGDKAWITGEALVGGTIVCWIWNCW